jgi:hypothetical protein
MGIIIPAGTVLARTVSVHLDGRESTSATNRFWTRPLLRRRLRRIRPNPHSIKRV